MSPCETDSLLSSPTNRQGKRQELEPKKEERILFKYGWAAIVLALIVGLLAVFVQPRVVSQDPDVDLVGKVAEDEMKKLSLQLDGKVFLRLDDGFADAARVWRQDVVTGWNSDVDKSNAPLAVIEAASEKDVQLAVPVLAKLSQEHSVPFRIRSGGHNKAGFCTVPEGVVLSLRNLKSIQLVDQYPDEANMASSVVVAQVQPGATVEDVLDDLLEGKEISGAVGMCGHVGEGGWVLGGGVGWMTRTLGLGIDNVLGFRVVLYNGTVVTANATSHPDLFWALRGAGSGNYGVVTSMEYKYLYPVPKTQLFGNLSIPVDDLPGLLYELGRNPPSREFVPIFGMGQQPDGQLSASAIYGWFSADPEILAQGHDKFMQEVAPFLSTAATYVAFAPVSWANSTHQYFDFPWKSYGMYVYAAQIWQGFMMPANNTRAIWSDIVTSMKQITLECPNVRPSIELWAGGAMSDVGHDETAFPYRDALYNVGVMLYVLDESQSQSFLEQVNKVNKWWPSVCMYLTGAYVNYPMNSLRKDEYPRIYWGSHLERVMSVKQAYDPQNVFNYEQSVPLSLGET